MCVGSLVRTHTKNKPAKQVELTYRSNGSRPMHYSKTLSLKLVDHIELSVHQTQFGSW